MLMCWKWFAGSLVSLLSSFLGIEGRSPPPTPLLCEKWTSLWNRIISVCALFVICAPGWGPLWLDVFDVYIVF